jgi:3-oxoacyl-[acyl-carrier protein] reductase
MLLRDRVAIVTGSATGIGEAVARLFADHGAHLLLMDRNGPGCEAVASSLTNATAFAGDVRSATDFARVVDHAVQHNRRIDVLINNAGIYPRQNFLEMTEAQWDQMQDINLKSMFHSMKAVLPHMVGQRSGKIVNISSVTFHLGMATLSHYVASKGGVIGLTRSLAREMGPHNIHINCITPGAIKTAAEANVVTEEQAREFLASQSLQRRIMPLDVARVCLFLSSELSDGMTGQVLNVDGGWVMH